MLVNVKLIDILVKYTNFMMNFRREYISQLECARPHGKGVVTENL